MMMRSILSPAVLAAAGAAIAQPSSATIPYFPSARPEGRPGIKAYRARRKVKNRMAALSRRNNRRR